MELGVVGDRVYAAERIMKKRVRKVMDYILIYIYTITYVSFSLLPHSIHILLIYYYFQTNHNDNDKLSDAGVSSQRFEHFIVFFYLLIAI